MGAALLEDCSPKVVFYHDVGTRYTQMGTPANLFWAHMEILRDVCLDGGACHRLCFDDGFRGVWDERETFRSLGIRPTVFIAIRLVGKLGYLTWAEIKTLSREYGFIFQCHTWSHQTLIGPLNKEAPVEDRTDGWYLRELVNSKVEIEHQTERVVDELCFPVGYFNRDIVQRCIAAGYRRVFSSIPGNLGSGVGGEWSGYVEPRCLCQFLDPKDFALVLRGGMNILARHYQKKHFIG